MSVVKLLIYMGLTKHNALFFVARIVRIKITKIITPSRRGELASLYIRRGVWTAELAIERLVWR